MEKAQLHKKQKDQFGLEMHPILTNSSFVYTIEFNTL